MCGVRVYVGLHAFSYVHDTCSVRYPAQGIRMCACRRIRTCISSRTLHSHMGSHWGLSLVDTVSHHPASYTYARRLVNLQGVARKIVGGCSPQYMNVETARTSPGLMRARA